MSNLVAAVDRRTAYLAWLPGAPPADSSQVAFEAGWEAALKAVELGAAHWRACGLNEAGQRAMDALRRQTSACRLGWDCDDTSHEACRKYGDAQRAALGETAQEGTRA